jgi:hypothetical protein
MLSREKLNRIPRRATERRHLHGPEQLLIASADALFRYMWRLRRPWALESQKLLDSEYDLWQIGIRPTERKLCWTAIHIGSESRFTAGSEEGGYDS